MPAFDFRCPICGKIKETRDSEVPPTCFHLGQGTPSIDNDDPDSVVMKRVYSNIGIAFKGSGFAKNDFSVKKPQ